MRSKILKIIIPTSLLFAMVETGLTANAAALNIRAKNISINQRTSSMVYTGNVRLSHKRLRIIGARAVTTSKAADNKSNSKQVTLTGRPTTATFVNKTGLSTKIKSDKLAYDSRTRIVVATGNVIIKTKNGSLTAYKIKYNLGTDQFSMEGNKQSPRVFARLKTQKKARKKP